MFRGFALYDLAWMNRCELIDVFLEGRSKGIESLRRCEIGTVSCSISSASTSVVSHSSHDTFLMGYGS